MDPYSPVAPAQIRVLVLPVGNVERARYLALLDRLRAEGSAIRLEDVEALRSSGSSDLQLSPEWFPQGSLFYNYTASVPSEQQQQLSPFELFREPLLVLGVKAGLSSDEEDDQKELRAAAEYLKQRHTRIVHRQLLVLEDDERKIGRLPEEVICIRNAIQSRDSSLRKAICRFSARFLRELATYTQAMQASPSIQTPGQTAKSLKRTTSLRDQERQSVSGYKTPPQQSLEMSRSMDAVDDSRSTSAPMSGSPPPTSFDQMPNTNGATISTRTGRPDSRASNSSKSTIRASSQDGVYMQGFGSIKPTSQEKTKARGKARVGIVTGHLYLMAGQWSEAFKLLTEHTSKARSLSDHLWNAKGLEGMVVCMLLHAWAGLQFQIPPSWYPTERPTSAASQRFSVDLQSPNKSNESSRTSIGELSASLPSLIKFILNLYSSGEGSLELPFITVAEAAIRFGKLLAMLRNAGGELNEHLWERFTKANVTSVSQREATTPVSPSPALTKTAVAEMLTYADPTGEENVPVADQAAVLAGRASVYALLHMDRKKSATIKDLVVKLTSSLIQARKRGAAEMGIHPAASLSADASTNTLLSIAEESGGFSQLMSDVAAVYGVAIDDIPTCESGADGFKYFGNDNLKLSFIKALAAFCEASPDLNGVVRINTSMLRAFGPSAAVDAEPVKRPSTLGKEGQTGCLTSITRTIGVSKMLGMPEIEAEYWDDFLVREVEVIPAHPDQALADLSKVKPGQGIEQTAANPLLYDPHANRPRTADEVQQTSILVANEVSVCRITLQNPYEVSVEVESLSLISEGVELETSGQRCMLAPFGIQRVFVSIHPRTPGDCKITGCRVKIQSCREKDFQIVSKPWSPKQTSLLKDSSQPKTSHFDPSKDKKPSPGPQKETVPVTVIEPQPKLVVKDNSLVESTLMLLDGEAFELQLTLRNTSSIPAAVFDVVPSHDAIQLQRDFDDNESTGDGSEDGGNDPWLIEPGESMNFTFDIVGRPSLFQVRVSFHYTSCLHATHARILSVPINMTVNAGLEVKNLEALPMDIAQNGEYSFVFCLDVGNAWPKKMFYSCFVADLGLKSAEPRRCHNHEGTLAPGQMQRVFMPVARPGILDEGEESLDLIRQALLSRLRIYWEVEGEERVGEVDVGSLTMSTEALKIAAGDAITLYLELAKIEGKPPSGPANTVAAGSFATLRATLTNRASRTSPMVIQLQSRPLNSSDHGQYDKHVAVAGSQHRFLPPIPEGGQEIIDFAVCPLLAGVVEIEVLARAALPKVDSGPQWTSHAKIYLTVT